MSAAAYALLACLVTWALPAGNRPPARDLSPPGPQAAPRSYIGLPLKLSLSPMDRRLAAALPDSFAARTDPGCAPGSWYRAARGSPARDADGRTLRWIIPVDGEARSRIAAQKTREGCRERTVRCDFQLRQVLEAEARISDDWTLTVDARDGGRRWTRPCRFDGGASGLDLTDELERGIRDRMPRALDALEGGLRHDLQPALARIWSDARRPLDLGGGVHLTLGPRDLGTGPVEVRGDTAVVLLGLRLDPELHVDGAPAGGEVPPLPSPSFKATRKDMRVHVDAHLPYARASGVATERLRGERVAVAGRAVEIRSVAFAAAGDSLKVSVEVRGAAKGTLHLYGIPTYGPRDSTVHFEALDFDVKSRNLLVQAGNFLAHGMIRRRLERELRWSVGPRLTAGRRELTEWLNRDLGAGFRLRGAVDRLEPASFRVETDRLVVRVEATGQAALTFRSR